MLRRFEALTEEDKALIKELCKEAGIKASFRKTCVNCYQDALMLLKLHYNVATPDTDIVTPSGNFVYHNGLKKVVWWFRHSVYTLTSQTDDATIERYMAVHPSQTHFSRVEQPDGEPEDAEPIENDGNGTQSGENADGGTTEQPNEENPSTGENAENNEGVNVEGDNDGKEQTDEENS